MRIFDNPNVDFLRWRLHATVLSVVVILAGVGTIIARGGLPLGVDFTGGTVVVLDFVQPVNEDAVRQAIGSDFPDALVQRIGDTSENQVMVRLPLSTTQAQAGDLDASARRVEERVRASSLGEFIVASKDVVGPTIGSDLQRKATLATITALGGILLYIGFRFRFSFAVGAIVATLHDILMTLVFLTWFGYDLSLNVVAAILTIAGYSVNDTIVIFDRVRENQRAARKESLLNIVNHAVNQTLGRTIITAGTTFLAVLGLFLFGGEVLQGFAFTMIIGIITGTYSTIFIASGVAILLSRRTMQAKQVSKSGDASRRARA